jgi:hypothetical protein
MTITCGGIQADKDHIAKFEGAALVKKVRFSDIRTITWQSGYLSKDPILQAGFGVVLTLIGLSPLRYLYNWYVHGGTAWDYQFLLTTSAIVGVWLIVDSRRRGEYLEISGTSEELRISFAKGTTHAEVGAFVTELRTLTHVPIQVGEQQTN